MHVQTTLNFFGRTEQALEFYCRAVDAEILFLLRFRQSPDQSFARPGLENKIYHATFRVGSTVLMASDCGCTESPSGSVFAGFSLVLHAATREEAERFFARLCDDGHIEIPLTETCFATRYGIVVDQFGISWKIIVESAAPA